MKKTKLIVTGILACILMLGCLTACAGTSQQGKDTPAEDSPVGSYSVYAIGEEDVYMTKDVYEYYLENSPEAPDTTANGYDLKVELSTDGTCTLITNNANAKGTWKQENGIITVGDKTTEMSGTYKDGALYLSINGSTTNVVLAKPDVTPTDVEPVTLEQVKSIIDSMKGNDAK